MSSVALEPNFTPDPDGKSDYGNPYLFTGRRVDILDDGSLKIQYNRNRYYDYHTGRWLTQDPLGITPNPQKPNRFDVIAQYTDGLSLYEYAGGNPLAKKDPLGLADPLRAFCNFLFLGEDIDIDEETNPDAQILHEVRNLASVRTYIEYLKNHGRRAIVNLGKKMRCPSSSATWSFSGVPKVHIVPIWHIGLRLTLQQFTLQGNVSCKFQKRCCSERCPGLPISPCGLVMGKCKARMHVHDKYDFGDVLIWLNLLGESYNIDIWWSEYFQSGPKVVCGEGEQCSE